MNKSSFSIVLRYVSWSAYLLRYNTKSGTLDPVAFTHAPFSHYYVQEETDDGIIMETDVTLQSVRTRSYLTSEILYLSLFCLS